MDRSAEKSYIDKYIAACLRGDVKRGMAVLRRQSAKKHSKCSLLLAKAERRFVDGKQPAIKTRDGLVRDVVAAYRRYYVAALTSEGRAPKIERQLDDDLRLVAQAHDLVRGRPRKNLDLESLISSAFKERGIYGLFGRVAPLRSALIWEKQTRRQYTVRLPEGVEKVSVFLLDSFAEESWLNYATFGMTGVGGWAKPNGLFCVQRKYRLSSDKFKCSFLVHEAQHFADYRRYPRLEQSDLEYRAKLAELWAATRPKQLLARFENEATNDRSIPHGFAAHCLMRDLAEVTHERRGGSSREALREAAFALIREHSKRLARAGASTSGGVLR